ncbi:redoxin domain-containing protein [Psychromarinibacter sp. C21-152]|uniref:Alkyl hydroperoxide reductase C n=1 Tax=Psychromarinibacter sediminicola TaxID=3033385 RepID=A0AAE3NT72_9RHOB|nr:redoxin domain-containing protein [Psychromarinibacter sediminicola]MDF0603888.1 redoxin domain-containing protein [Psychromarinibacter sediminicola]
MNMTLFAGSSWKGGAVCMPASYRRHVAWMPQIGDIFPDFTALTTEGQIQFFEWAEGSWTVLFSHPCAFTPICTTELAALAEASGDFARRNVKLLAFTKSSLLTQVAWHREVESLFEVKINFPSVEDADGQLSQLFGMVHPKQGELPGRRTMLLDPSMRIRLIVDYPAYLGRSTEEILRAIDGAQAQDDLSVQLPADWTPGDMYVLPKCCSEEEAFAKFGAAPTELTPYLRVVQGQP